MSNFSSLQDLVFNLDAVYALPEKEQNQIKANLIIENFKYHYKNNDFYREACEAKGIGIDDIQSFDDLIKIPLIPVKRFKDVNSHVLLTKGLHEIEYEMRSTGTSGIPSVSRRDSKTVDNAILSLFSMYREFFKLSTGASLYLMPSTEDIPEMGMIKVLGMISGLTDASWYAVKGKMFKAPEALEMLNKWEGKHTRHIIGPPFLIHKFIKYLEKNNIELQLDKGSYVINLGGWKRFTGEQIPRAEYDALCEQYFGIPKSNVRDTYGLVECNSLAVECHLNHKHVSPWVHYSVRDINDLSKEVPAGERGVLAILDPISMSYPTFVLTEDLVYLNESSECDCGRNGQVVNYISRVRGAEIGCCAINLEKQMDTAEANEASKACVIL